MGKPKHVQALLKRERKSRKRNDDRDEGVAARKSAAKKQASEVGLSTMSAEEFAKTSIPDDIFLKDMMQFQEYTDDASNFNAPDWLIERGADASAGAASSASKKKKAWKHVDLNEFNDFGGLMSLEVLDDDGSLDLVVNPSTKSKKGGKHSDAADDAGEAEDAKLLSEATSKKPKKSKKSKDELDNDAVIIDDVASSKPTKKQKQAEAKKVKKQQTPAAAASASTATAASASSTKKRKHSEVEQEQQKQEEEFVFDEELMKAWEPFADVVHADVLENLQKLGFYKPTPVQQRTLELMLQDPSRNLIAAAETGSGKTLAFGIPLASAILDAKDNEQKQEDAANQNKKQKKDSEEQHSYHDGSETDDKTEEGKVTEAEAKLLSKLSYKGTTHLKALVLTPTRELAIQVSNHIKTIIKNTSVHCAAIVGGMSVEKQERLLSYRPEIIVATPGRYWDLTVAGVKHLTELDQLRCICIDEADRMLAEGHFEEVYNILGLINKARLKMKTPPHLQKYVLSATLTLSSKWRERSSSQDVSMVDKLMKVLDMQDHQLVDLTPQNQMARTLKEAQVQCMDDEKDTYLYYLLLLHPGRTIVFCNSISGVRHLQTLLTTLKVSVFALHGEMQQRQRLKNLEKFRNAVAQGAESAVLVATDVAARGLDIPNVDSVIHFQMPRAAETYVHRCGRAGRASKSGISVAIVSPADRKEYYSICAATNKSDGLEEFPVSVLTIKNLAKRVKLASRISSFNVENKRKKSNVDWFQKNAEMAGVDLDDTFFPDMAEGVEEDLVKTNEIQKLKEELSKLLAQNITDPGVSRRFLAGDLNNLEAAVQSQHRATIEKTFEQSKKQKQEQQPAKQQKKEEKPATKGGIKKQKKQKKSKNQSKDGKSSK